MERGEVWWAHLDERRPVVILSVGSGPDLRAAQIVAPATPAERHGFLIMSGAAAVDPNERQRIIGPAGSSVIAVGVEVAVGGEEGLPYDGVVRVALPSEAKVFCTWMLTLSTDCLIKRIGVLSPEKLYMLENVVELAGIE